MDNWSACGADGRDRRRSGAGRSRYAVNGTWLRAIVIGIIAVLAGGAVHAQTGMDEAGGGAMAPRNRIVAVKNAKLGREVGEVRINGRTVFRFRGAKGGDPYTRAQIIAGRLNADYMANLQPREVRATRVAGYWVVTARGQLLITADAWTARINSTTPRALAREWARRVRQQLRGPEMGTQRSGNDVGSANERRNGADFR